MLAIPLPHHQKINRLFAYYHSRTEPELTNVAVATILGQRLNKDVSAGSIERARAGLEVLPDETSAELCKFMGIDTAYLVSPRKGEDHRIDRQLHLWTLARDRGLQHLAVRAGHHQELDVIELLISELAADN